MAIQDYAAAAKATAGAAPAAQTPGLKPLPAPTPDTKIAQLAAAAQGGSAGLTAYKQAQTELDQLQANALANARQRASLIGGPEAQGFEAIAAQDYDRARRNLSTQEQSFQGHQAANKDAFGKYFGQLKGDMGAINNWIKGQLGRYDSNLSAKALAKAQAAAKSNAKSITLDQLIGAASSEPSIMKDSQNILGQAVGGENIAAANLLDRARQIGTEAGVDPFKLAGLREPGRLKGLTRDLSGSAPDKQLPASPSKEWIMQNVTMPGTTQKATASRADDVLSAPEVAATAQFVGQLMNAKINNGVLDDDGSTLKVAKGYTPEQAFIFWVDAQPGTLTMKQAMKDYYIPWIRQNVT